MKIITDGKRFALCKGLIFKQLYWPENRFDPGMWISINSRYEKYCWFDDIETVQKMRDKIEGKKKWWYVDEKQD